MSNSAQEAFEIFSRHYDTFQQEHGDFLAQLFPQPDEQGRLQPTALTAKEFFDLFTRTGLHERLQILDKIFEYGIEDILTMGKDELNQVFERQKQTIASQNQESFPSDEAREARLAFLALNSPEYLQARNRIAIERAHALANHSGQYEKAGFLVALVNAHMSQRWQGLSETEINLQASLSMQSFVMERSATNPYMAERFKLTHNGQMHSLKSILWLCEMYDKERDIFGSPQHHPESHEMFADVARALIDHDNGELWGEVLVAADTAGVAPEIIQDFKEWRKDLEGEVAHHEMVHHLKLLHLQQKGVITTEQRHEHLKERTFKALQVYSAWRDLHLECKRSGRAIPTHSEITEHKQLQQALEAMRDAQCPFDSEEAKALWQVEPKYMPPPLASAYDSFLRQHDMLESDIPSYQARTSQVGQAVRRFMVDAIEKLETNWEIIHYGRQSEKSGSPHVSLDRDAKSGESLFRYFYPGKAIRKLKAMFSVSSTKNLIEDPDVNLTPVQKTILGIARKMLRNQGIVALGHGAPVLQADGWEPALEEMGVSTSVSPTEGTVTTVAGMFRSNKVLNQPDAQIPR